MEIYYRRSLFAKTSYKLFIYVTGITIFDVLRKDTVRIGLNLHKNI